MKLKTKIFLLIFSITIIILVLIINYVVFEILPYSPIKPNKLKSIDIINNPQNYTPDKFGFKFKNLDFIIKMTYSTEYKEYMALRRDVKNFIIKRRMFEISGKTRLLFMSDADKRVPNNVNDQGIVIKVEQRSQMGDSCLTSVMLPGDSNAQVWRDGILKDYTTHEVRSSILMAAHHGSKSFFEIPGDLYYYTSHIEAIKPAMVIISVGANTHGHPDKQALSLYEKYATGSGHGHKVARTDQRGTMKLTLKTEGSWALEYGR